MTLSLNEHVSDVVFAGSEWQIMTCQTCRQVRFIGRVEHNNCAVCQDLIDRGFNPQAIADQTAARIGFIATRDGLDPQQGGVALGWDGRWHFSTP
jgi:hypothetical protein